MSSKFLNNKILFLIIIGCLLLGVALIYWIFKPDHQEQAVHEHPETAMLSGSNSLTYKNTGNNVQGTLPTQAASLRGAEIDCPIQVDANGRLVLTAGIRSCFNYFFSTLGEKTEQQVITDLKQYLSSTLPDTASGYALYLLDQYVAYTHALKNLKPDARLKKGDIEAFEKIVGQMNWLQQQYFNPAEIQALFGNERNLNQFNLAQMRIHASQNLTAGQKATEIAELIDQLPPALGDGVRVSMQFAELQQLTLEIQAKGGSSQEIRAMRENLLGAEAADRLEKVDQEENNWQKQVNSYLTARDDILNGNGKEASKQQALDTLRSNTFTTKEDQIRAQTYEIMHDRK